MKLRITGFEEQKVTSNVEKENPTIDEKISSKIPDEEKSDFEYILETVQILCMI